MFANVILALVAIYLLCKRLRRMPLLALIAFIGACVSGCLFGFRCFPFAYASPVYAIAMLVSGVIALIFLGPAALWWDETKNSEAVILLCLCAFGVMQAGQLLLMFIFQFIWVHTNPAGTPHSGG